MIEELLPCAECGMPCSPKEYHPYAACLMFKACHNSETVRANLDFVRNTRPDSKQPDLTNYPNLSAILQGCVSGKLGEWPGVRAELSRLLKSFGVPDQV